MGKQHHLTSKAWQAHTPKLKPACLLSLPHTSHDNTRYPIPNPLPANLGPNFVGWVSLFTLPTSLIASCMLNEGFWQRVWASADRRTLHKGAGVGFGAVVIVIFLSGFGGWLALAAGLIDDKTNPNVYLMQVGGPCSLGCWGASCLGVGYPWHPRSLRAITISRCLV